MLLSHQALIDSLGYEGYRKHTAQRELNALEETAKKRAREAIALARTVDQWGVVDEPSPVCYDTLWKETASTETFHQTQGVNAARHGRGQPLSEREKARDRYYDIVQSNTPRGLLQRGEALRRRTASTLEESRALR